MKTIILFLLLGSIGNVFGQQSDNPTFKRHIIGVSTGFGFYSSYMITPTNLMEPLRSKGVSYTYRIQPRFGVTLDYLKATAAEAAGDVGTKHLFLSAKMTTKATKRFQAFLSPGIGLGFYDYSQMGETLGYVDKLLDFGGSAGLDIHFLKRLIFTYSFNFRANFDVEPFYYSQIGLAVKL